MSNSSDSSRLGSVAMVAACLFVILSSGAEADSVLLKNGIIYRGTVDRDDTIVWVYDGIKRIVIRETKISKIQSDGSLNNYEVFRVEQPLTVHTGAMPKEVIRTHAEPWSDRGRRRFEFEGATIGKVFRMEQAINELGPYLVKIRGVDGFWKSQLATNQVPREIVMAILAKVNRGIESERFRVARFLIQAEWYDEAEKELEYLLKAFPDDAHLKERLEPIRASIIQAQSIQSRIGIDRAKAAGQPKLMAALVKSIAIDKVAADLADAIGEIDRNLTAQAAADQATIDDLKALSLKLPPETLKAWKGRLDEALAALTDAPDVVRDNFVAWRTGSADGGKSPEAEFALALSGLVVGSDAAIDNLGEARAYWDLRDLLQKYLADPEDGNRPQTLSMIESLPLKTDEDTPEEIKKLDIMTRLAVRMPPPLARVKPAKPSEKPEENVRRHEILEPGNDLPTEYVVAVPPEYHPLRSYPAIVALHDGRGPKTALQWWSAEAARRGYIVVAPEYMLPGQRDEYHYTENEHAAVEIALRDAKRRYAIDSNRVFVGGQLIGANMAWDFGLSHPDLFAGSVVVSGMPFKYVNKYLNQTEMVPLYAVLGDLAPAANEVVFGAILKPMIEKAWDVTYVEYLKRGPEDFPEEAPGVFDWMDRRRREPYPKTFDVVSARPSDNRYFGAVVEDFDPKRMTAPEMADGFGKGMNAATIKFKASSMSNLLSYETSGVKRMDVWVPPALIDFKKRCEVRINRKSWFKGFAKPEVGMFLEDLRIRGDRQQIYWLKIPAR